MTQLASRVRTTPLPASLPAGAQLRVATVPQRPEGYARLIGELDLASVEVVRANICRLIASNRDVVVDLAPLSFCDAAGIGLFLELTKIAHGIGHTITFARPRPEISRIFAVTNVDRVLSLATEDARFLPSPVTLSCVSRTCHFLDPSDGRG
jgi:anti-anti-sigma factor